jgi:hypothetical protein
VRTLRNSFPEQHEHSPDSTNKVHCEMNSVWQWTKIFAWIARVTSTKRPRGKCGVPRTENQVGGNMWMKWSILMPRLLWQWHEYIQLGVDDFIYFINVNFKRLNEFMHVLVQEWSKSEILKKKSVLMEIKIQSTISRNIKTTFSRCFFFSFEPGTSCSQSV